MAKKQKKVKPKEVPTKRQLSRWQRQKKMQRVIIIAAAVFLAGILGYVGYDVGYGYYDTEIRPLREVMIEVNDASFTTGYYVKLLDAYTKGEDASQVYYMADVASRQIVRDELIRQGADSLGISVETHEVDESLEETDLPDEDIYRDAITAILLNEKLLEDYFGPQLADTMEQAHVQVMLVESKEIANEVRAKIESGQEFTALTEELSCNPEVGGDLDWLPRELMSDTLGDVAFSLEPGEISQPIYDESTSKSVGYWLIQVTDTDEEEGIQAKVMLLGSKEEADGIKAKLDSGEDFADLATEYSQHESKDNGGELGWIKQGDMGDAFDEVAFNLTSNELSEPVRDTSVQTTGGYWVVKNLDRGEHELSEDAKEALNNQHFSDWIEEREENSTINIDGEKELWAVQRVMEGK
ncbi:MAG: peptidylprolyl isomerase [Dehalococcoidia bacterium]|nr:peptidylprolyl isomerase [Dehalococcoidia bacterium]